MPAIYLADRVMAIQYTGSNSAEIDGLITDFTIDSEGGGTLAFTSGGSPYSVSTGEWVRYAQGAVLNTHTTSFLNFAFVRNAIYDDVTALQSQVDGLMAADALLSAGVQEAPLLIVGSTVVSVNLIPAMPDTSYTPHAQLFASTAILGPLSITAVSVVDTDTVNVTILNGGLVGITGARVLVTVTS